MLVNFKNKLIDFYGNEGETYEIYVINAIAAQDKTITEVQQLDNYRLVLRIRDVEGEIEINLTEKKQIMDGIVKNIALPLITGRFTDLFTEKA